jgi:Domain of unknown function (DUF4956)
MNGLVTGTQPALDVADLALRLLIDLVAVAALAYGLYYRRHRRRDLLTVYVAFNVGVFIVVTAISLGQIAVAVGFGLFAVLAMIRLRSEPYSHAEFAYFFLALVLALATGVDIGSLPVTVGLCALALVTILVVDRPTLVEPIERMEVTLEAAIADAGELGRRLEERLNARIVDATVLEIDYVRETTRVQVQYRRQPRPVDTPYEAAQNGRDARDR